MNIKFGTAGIGGIKEAENNLHKIHKAGLRTCEIAFTYQIYIKDKKTAQAIKKTAKKLKISLTVHAPYWINLNSKDKEKKEKSKQRILESCRIGEQLGAKLVVFHPGYYEKSTKEETYQEIKKQIKEMQKIIKQNKWKIKLAPEIMGKTNVFGTPEEISKLTKETGCSFCIDFAHVLAREKRIDHKKIKKLFPQKKWHIHYSGIEYGEKGEKRHTLTENKHWKYLLKKLPENKNITIICESPDPFKDSIQGLKIYQQNLKKKKII